MALSPASHWLKCQPLCLFTSPYFTRFPQLRTPAFFGEIWGWIFYRKFGRKKQRFELKIASKYKQFCHISLARILNMYISTFRQLVSAQNGYFSLHIHSVLRRNVLPCWQPVLLYTKYFFPSHIFFSPHIFSLHIFSSGLRWVMEELTALSSPLTETEIEAAKNGQLSNVCSDIFTIFCDICPSLQHQEQWSSKYQLYYKSKSSDIVLNYKSCHMYSD